MSNGNGEYDKNRLISIDVGAMSALIRCDLSDLARCNKSSEPFRSLESTAADESLGTHEGPHDPLKPHRAANVVRQDVCKLVEIVALASCFSHR